MKKGITFEQAMKRLEVIAGNIQAQDISLDESLKLYTEAAELIAFCSGKLENAKIQIEHIDIKKDEFTKDEQC